MYCVLHARHETRHRTIFFVVNYAYKVFFSSRVCSGFSHENRAVINYNGLAKAGRFKDYF